jgi:two-component system NtrC family sensor kinase
MRSYELSAFASVQKPFEIGQLFATIERASERRRMNLDNRRLVWELQTINEIADGIAGSLELTDVVDGSLRRLVRALSVVAGAIRLKDPLTGTYEPQAAVGPAAIGQLRVDHPELPWPSARVIATRTAVLVDDFRALLPPEFVGEMPVRSALSVPMTAGDELLGTLTVGAAVPGRFLLADQRLVTIIAGQIAVAVQNARLHDSIRRAKREWEQTFDAISDPIAVFNGRGELLRGNIALAAHLGRAVTHLGGVTCHDVGFCDPSCTGVPEHRGVARTEVTRPDGQIFSVTTDPIAGGADGASVVQVAKNVTEEIRSARRLRQMSEELATANAQAVAALDRVKSTQAQLLQSEKLSAIGQLVAGVAHELNNPLTSVIGYAQLLEEELLDQSAGTPGRPIGDLAHDLRRIAEESERAARIVRNLLAFARRQSAARVPQDVAELFSRVLSLRSYEFRLNGVELQIDFEAALPSVIADASQLQQALLNLVLNAEQAMRGRARRRLHVGARFDDVAAAVELFVSDTGHGIDSVNLSRVFDPFFTTRDVGEGTGLGLSICYGIIRDHGGQITVDSRLNAGTTFSVLLPARIERPGTLEPILVVHGDQGERDYVTATLSGWGHDVLPAASSREGLSLYRGRSLQAILLDRGVLASDLGAWREARAQDLEAVPLILMSLAAEDGEVERFGREQAGAVLAPPFQLRGLRSAVRAVCKECV